MLGYHDAESHISRHKGWMFLSGIIMPLVAIYISCFRVGTEMFKPLNVYGIMSPVFLIYSKEGINFLLLFYCVIKPTTLRICDEHSNKL